MRIVSVRDNRNCMYCHTIIPKGARCVSKSLFYRRDFIGHRWVCFECLHKISKYWDMVAEERLIPEGDTEAKAKHDEYVNEYKETISKLGYFG